MTDFPRAEYEARLEAANRAMHANNLDAICWQARPRSAISRDFAHSSGKAPHAHGL